MTTNPLQSAPWRHASSGAKPSVPRAVPQAFLRNVSESIKTTQILCLCQIAMLILLSILVVLK